MAEEQKQQPRTNCSNCRSLDARRKMGWKNYFTILAMYENMSRQMIRLLDEMKAGDTITIPPHFVDEMMTSLKELDCVVCFERMTKETFNLTPCFHKVCRTCVDRIKQTTKKCPICRKALK